MEQNIEWRVRLFRHTLDAGWQAVQASFSTNKAASEGVSKQKGAAARQLTQIVRAAPQKGAIVLRRLRLRITLNDDVVLTRRKHCLRVQSQQGVKVVVLQFPAVKDCLTFCDCLLLHNPLVTVDMEQNDLYSQLTRRNASEHERESVLFYIAGLLYDPEFMATVESLEQNLVSTRTGKAMLMDFIKLAPSYTETEGEQEKYNDRRTETI